MNEIPKFMKSAAIREAFLKFYADRGHFREQSASLLPQNDPTLLFTAAGMVPFKDVFTGIEKRAYTRATTAQRCVRAGGKHNDLENVGFTKRHQTFFEMLGNFSFGDYFKKEAIAWAWELSTKVLGLPVSRLYVTVHITDDEAAEIWEKVIGVPKERIFRFDADNFWSAGDVGPCGPCSEIFYDRGEAFNTGDPDMDRVGGDGDRFLEFYNLVFMQFERDENGDMNPLPRPSVDTGMGLERISSIIQNVDSNYETDLFSSIIHEIKKASPRLKKQANPEEIANAKILFQGIDSADRVALQVVADHLRAISYLIADGLTPANDGAGYVLRRILRRAVRFGRNLGFDRSFLADLVPAVTKQLGSVHPVLVEQEKLVQEMVRAEEDKFFLTLEKGLGLLQDSITGLSAGATIDGKTAFLMYDSFGFPLDLTQMIARERGLEVDTAGFDECMEQQRANSKVKDSLAKSEYEALYRELQGEMRATEFVGYDSFADLTLSGATVQAILADSERKKSVRTASEAQIVQLVFDKSVLYAESGGQAGDKGSLWQGEKKIATVIDVKKPFSDLAVVIAELAPNTQLSVGDSLLQKVAVTERRQIAHNHTATHLLHWALREVLGKHVKQAGSLVREDLLRFDFTHMQAMSPEQCRRVEDLVNEKILAAENVHAKEMAKDDAIAAGAMALFGEKYGDQVRVLTVGDFSVELCGGTHVHNTAQIGLFVITEESGVAAGTRRIVAKTGSNAFGYLRSKADIVDQLRISLKAGSPEEILERVAKMQLNQRELEKKLERMEERSAVFQAKEILDSAIIVGGIPFIGHSMEGDAKAVRALADKLRTHQKSGVIALASASEGKAFILVSVSKDLAKSLPAGKLVQAAAPKIDGRGGGKPEVAQAGGNNPGGLVAALEVVRSELAARSQ